MKLAFYYHIPYVVKNDRIWTLSHLGIFIDALANISEELFLIFHEAKYNEQTESDYCLQAFNLRLVNLGEKTPAWHREIFYNKILKNRLRDIEACDAFLIRSPSPLAPYFCKYLKGPLFVYMIVGDYAAGAKNRTINNVRDRIINRYLIYNDKRLSKVVSRNYVIVNSFELYNKYVKIASSVDLIKTTTLREIDFFKREDTCLNALVEVLYTGRIDPSKGLFELVSAIKILKGMNYLVRLNIVGWDSSVNKYTEIQLRKMVSDNKLDDDVILHGKMRLGSELNNYYRSSDIFVLPSYHEGFPRSIWEAMANSLPVITTKVGGIPYFLTSQLDAILIEPKNVNEIVLAIKQMIDDRSLRKSLIIEAYKKAIENTLENQTRLLYNAINRQIWKKYKDSVNNTVA